VTRQKTVVSELLSLLRGSVVVDAILSCDEPRSADYPPTDPRISGLLLRTRRDCDLRCAGVVAKSA